MKIFLSKVEDVFDLKNSGCVVVPGIPVETADKAKIKAGDELELRFPDGTTMNTKVASLSFLSRTPETPPIPIALPKEYSKKDVPIGTELWIDEEKIVEVPGARG